MEDLFDKTKDRWQRHFRYPLVLRFLWVAGILIAVAALLVAIDWPRWEPLDKVRDAVTATPRRRYAAFGAAILAALWCVWVSFKSWATHIICSPTSIKMSVLYHGRRRISWVNIREVHYKWRLLGHTLTFFGSDGARVAFRSSINGYDSIIALLRDRVPDHINARLDELIGEEEDDQSSEDDTPRADDTGQPPQEGQQPAQAGGDSPGEPEPNPQGNE